MLTKKDKQDIREIFYDLFYDQVEGVYPKIRNDIAQFKDDILTELTAMREEHEILRGRTSNSRDALELHASQLHTLDGLHRPEHTHIHIHPGIS